MNLVFQKSKKSKNSKNLKIKSIDSKRRSIDLGRKFIDLKRIHLKLPTRVPMIFVFLFDSMVVFLFRGEL